MHLLVESSDAKVISDFLGFLGQLKQVPDGSVLLCSLGRKSSGTNWLKADIPTPEA